MPLKKRYTPTQASVLLADEILDINSEVGDLIQIDYNNCDILVHDTLRERVGGLPLGSFLLASRISLENAGNSQLSYDIEECCAVLLRIIGKSTLPNDIAISESRLEAAKRSSDSVRPWDHHSKLDKFTQYQLSFSGIKCRILGTFRVSPETVTESGTLESPKVIYNEDISNFYTGQGLKIYKPTKNKLANIANFDRHISRDAADIQTEERVPIGRLRYSASERKKDLPESVVVKFNPADLTAQRSALFGMSRTGKSNTAKQIIRSIHLLRGKLEGRKVGQLVLDPNGEYANDNAQDLGCLRNIADKNSVSTYGLTEHPNDKNRNLMKFDFFGTDPDGWDDREKIDNALRTLYEGKDLINEVLSQETAGYIKGFIGENIKVPDDLKIKPDMVRFKRNILIYRGILYDAGFDPGNKTITTNNLFAKELTDTMKSVDDENIKRSGELLTQQGKVRWKDVPKMINGLKLFLDDETYKKFVQNRKGKEWTDPVMRNLLAIYENTRGIRILKQAESWHSPGVFTDFTVLIVDELRNGKLVIVDQAFGAAEMNKKAAERLLKRLFNKQRKDFVNPTRRDNKIIPPPDIVIYAEEAHTLLPKGSEQDTTNIWSRIAKEGSKFRLGLVYSTQEPSSIQTNILKNTANWFIAHLNNSDEIKEIRKYYDFEDFSEQILRVTERGMIRMRTMTSSYTLPVQVAKFETEHAEHEAGQSGDSNQDLTSTNKILNLPQPNIFEQ